MITEECIKVYCANARDDVSKFEAKAEKQDKAVRKLCKDAVNQTTHDIDKVMLRNTFAMNLHKALINWTPQNLLNFEHNYNTPEEGLCLNVKVEVSVISTP